MANKQQGTYPLVTTLSPTARVFVFDNGQTVEIHPPDLATVLGAGGGGGGINAPANTTLPVIAGTAQVGQTLVVSNGLWTQNPTTYAYQWKSNGVNVGTNQSSYLVQSTDLGHTITCVVSATGATGTGSATTAGTAAVIAAGGSIPVNTVLPAITGSPVVGATLTCSQGTWSNSPTSYAFQWKSGGANVGLNQATYSPIGSDAGNTITCAVTATNANGSATATSAATAVVTVNAITFDATSKNANITLSNGNLTASLLTGVDGDHLVRGTQGYNASKRYFEVFTGQGWHREGGFGLAFAAISNTAFLGSNFNDSIGAYKDGIWLNNNLVLTFPAEVLITPDMTICIATDLDAKLFWFKLNGGNWNESPTADPATGAGGVSFAGLTGQLYPAADLVSVNDVVTLHVDVGTTFFPVPNGFQMWGLPVGTPPTNITLPVISGVAQAGNTLSVTNGTWNNSPSSFDYQWKVNNVNKGTNAPTYLLVAGDASFTATCTVTASNTGGANSATSAPTGIIAQAPPVPVNSVAPAITGTAAEDATLTCSTGTWSNSPVSYNFQWQIPPGTNVGTNQATYVPVAADVGLTARCVVTATNGGGSASANSNTTGTIASATPTAPVKTFDAVIQGTAQVGIPLFVTQGAWQQRVSNKPTSYSFQWKRGATNVGTNSNRYTPVVGDVGAAITCVVSAVNATGTTTSTTAATANVIAAITAPSATIDFGTSPSTATLATAGLTFTRATTGTYLDINGVMQTAAINTPRYQYTENGLHGLLKEPAATNYVFPSKPTTTGGRWAVAGSNTITPNNAAGPDGTTNASRIVLVSGVTGVGLASIPTMTYPSFGAVSAWVKGTKGERVYFFVQNASGGITYRIPHTFSGAWERTAPFRVGGANGRMGFATVANHALVADPTDGLPAVTFWVGDVQFEENYVATSAIPTTVAAVTRAEDFLTVTGSTPLSAMKTASTTNNTGGGTFFIDVVTVLNGSQWGLISSSTAGAWGIDCVVQGANTKGQLAGVGDAGDAGLGITLNVPQKVAGRWQRNNYGVCVDGYPTGVAALATTPVVSGNVWDIGREMNGGIIRELRFWNTALSNGDMEKLTALSPGYVMAATAAGAVKKGFTNLLFDIIPKKSDIATANSAAKAPGNPLFVGLYYSFDAVPDLTDYVDSQFGLSFPLSPAVTTMEPSGARKGKLPFMPGRDGFSVQFEFQISNNYFANFDACWVMPEEHNPFLNGMGWYDDSYFWSGDGPGTERWMEFDVHEGAFTRNSMNTVISWSGDQNAGGYNAATSNNSEMWGYLDRIIPHTLEGVFDADKLETSWYIDDVLCRVCYGNGFNAPAGGADNNWDGDNVPLIAREQKFYAIFNANSNDGSPYTMYVKRVRAYTKPTITDRKFVGYGDSLMYGTGSTIGNWVDLLGADLGKPTSVKGIGGETSQNIADRVQLDIGKYDPALDIFFFDGGYNNYLNAGFVEADFARMVAALNALGGSPKFLIVGIPTGEATYLLAENGHAVGDPGYLYNGAPGRTRVDTINANLAATYGTRFFDVNAYLVANGGDGTTNDNLDISRGIVPRSKRATGDAVHWNNPGYTLVKDGIKARLVTLGWA